MRKRAKFAFFFLWKIISGLVIGLRDFDGDAREAIPFLLQGLQSSSAYIQGISARTLKRIDPETAAQAGVK